MPQYCLISTSVKIVKISRDGGTKVGVTALAGSWEWLLALPGHGEEASMLFLFGTLGYSFSVLYAMQYAP